MNTKGQDNISLDDAKVKDLFHSLGKKVGKRHIDILSHFLKVEGKLRGEVISFPSGFYKVRLNVHKGEYYEFLCDDKNERKANAEYTVIRYPGFTLDPNYKETAVGNIVGIPSDKRTKKYYNRNKH